MNQVQPFYTITDRFVILKNEDNLKNEDDVKNEEDLKNEDDIKNKNDLKNEDNPHPPPLPPNLKEY